jgi:hypothetical protein
MDSTIRFSAKFAPTTNKMNVYLDNKVVGHIKKVKVKPKIEGYNNYGYQYTPKSSSNLKGEVYDTLFDCQQSLMGEP